MAQGQGLRTSVVKTFRMPSFESTAGRRLLRLPNDRRYEANPAL